MEAKKLCSKINELLSPIVESLGYELIETEYVNEHGRWILRLYIDVEAGGIKIGDLAKVSRTVNAILDVEDIIPSKYNLEVSSPGIPRPIRRVKDFQKHIGEEIKVQTYNKIGNRKKFTGLLKDVKGEELNMIDNGEVVTISIGDIYKARLKNESINGGKKNG